MKIWLTVSLATNHGLGQLFIAPKGNHLREHIKFAFYSIVGRDSTPETSLLKNF